jgi:formylmethanofuran dehydrogenase subunit B
MAIAPSTDRTSLRVVSDAVCTFCGCLCDDIKLTIDGNQVVLAENACTLGRTGFQEHTVGNRAGAMIHGAGVPLAEAFTKAAQLLTDARCPIVYGLSESVCEAQRLAVAIADRVGGCIDTPPGQAFRQSGMAFQSVGKVVCSLGEVKNRADLIVLWGTNPTKSHPRHAERYSTQANGLFTPNGRKDKYVVVVDVCHTASSADADLFLQILPGMDFEVLWCLRALIKGVVISESIEARTGINLEQLQDLANRMRSCQFGVLFYGPGLSKTSGGQMSVEASSILAQELNRFTRFYAMPIGERGNANGAENVVAWQTGYPCAVQLARGYPRYNPGEFSVSGILERGEADAALIISANSIFDLPQAAIDHLAKIPRIVLDSTSGSVSNSATVSFCVANYATETTGTVYRADDVPLPLKSIFDSPRLSQSSVLRGIDQAIRAVGSRI